VCGTRKKQAPEERVLAEERATYKQVTPLGLNREPVTDSKQSEMRMGKNCR
jgi:hypothetical protein